MANARKSETRKSRNARTLAYQRVYSDLLRKLIEAREAAGLTQQEVSARMGRARSFLSKCETGERSIDVIELLQLAEIYGRKPERLLESD